MFFTMNGVMFFLILKIELKYYAMQIQLWVKNPFDIMQHVTLLLID